MHENLYIAIPRNRTRKGANYGIFENFENFLAQLIPKPNRSYPKDLSIECEIPLKILTANFNPDDFILKTLVSELNKLLITTEFVSDSNFKQITTILGYQKKPIRFPLEHQKEGYSISINDFGILIQSFERPGMFYAIQTFLQILNQLSLKSKTQFLILPGLEIYDFPLFPIRGIAEDTSRGQCPTVESAKRYMDVLAQLKMNTYAIGYEGDNFYNEKHPTIGTKVAQWTPEEIKELDRYAKERFIDLLPIYVSLGHQDNILQISEYQDLAEFPSAQCFNITDERIYPFIEDYFQLLCDSFATTKAFHIGCDESYDVGIYKSKDAIEQKGRAQILLHHYNQVYELAKKYGKKQILMYHDIIAHYDDVLTKLPGDLHVMFWDYAPKKKYKLLKHIFKISNLPIILSPSHLSWCRHFPDIEASAFNIIEMIEYGKKLNKNKETGNPGIVGVLNSTWGDFNNPNFRENLIYGSAISAAASWQIKKPNVKPVLSAFIRHFFRISDKFLIDELTEIVWECMDLNNFYRSGPKFMPQLFFMHLFRNPFALGFTFFHYAKNYRMLNQKAKKIQSKLEDIAPLIIHNKKYLEYINFSLELIIILTLKEDLSTLSYAIDHSRNSKKGLSLKSHLITKIYNFQSKIEKMMPEYEKLWLYCAKRPVLDFNLMRLENLTRYCAEKIKHLKDTSSSYHPFLPSEWISSNTINTPPIGDFYRKTFHLEEKPEKAKLLCIAGTYGRVYVNGKLVGSIMSRMSLSILPIQNRIQLFDITKMLQIGTNLIAVEAYNFENIEPTFNCLLRYKLKGITQDIASDSSWRGFIGYNPNNPDLNMVQPSKDAKAVPNEWNCSTSLEFDADWTPVTSYGVPPKYNGHIYDEDILNGVIPLTEEYFGSKAWLYWAASAYLGKKIAKIAMHIYEPLRKLLRIA